MHGKWQVAQSVLPDRRYEKIISWHEDHGSSRNEKAEVRKMAEAEIYAKH